jgi:hypothetical protein
MGLKNAQQHYVHVVHVDVDSCVVRYRRHRSKAVRDNPTEFDQHLDETLRCLKLADLLRKQADSTKTIMQNLLTAAYQAMKQEPPFNRKGEWMDVLEKVTKAKTVVVAWED